MAGVFGADALRPAEGGSTGRPTHPAAEPDRDPAHPAHVEHGRPVVRTPSPAAVVPATATYRVDEIRGVPGTGTTVTVSGPAAVITDLDEAARPHCLKGMRGAPLRRTPRTRTDGAHDVLLSPRPRTGTGLRPARAEV
ncbi:hypothetical protein C6376_35720 [Streptomyces sp. P3]|nr:hypothetical protein C6376_35720 [Streptomyces sp. P3]